MRKTFLIFLVLLVIYILFIAIYSNFHGLYIPKKIQTEFYNLFDKFDNMCQDNQIPYFIVAGTLLGAVRHEGIIPWDDDIDVGILEKDLEKLQNIDCSKYGMISKQLVKTSTGKFFHDDKLNNGKKMQSVFIDVFVMAKDSPSDDKYYYCNPEARRDFNNEHFYESELQNIVFYKFGPLCVPGIYNYEDYLKRVYVNWKIPQFTILKNLLYPLQSIYMFIKYRMGKNLGETDVMKKRRLEKEKQNTHEHTS